MVSRSKNDPNYGEGEVSLEDDDEVLIDEDALSEKLLATFRDPAYQPPILPAVATELMELSARPDVDFGAVVALLENDAMIAGRVLQVAQSPLYTSSTDVPSLKNAVTRLGLRTIRDLVMEVVMNLRVFRCDPYADTMERLRRHATATAHIARKVGSFTSIAADYAFLCGLMHDVGIAGTLIGLAEEKGTPPDLVAIWPAIDRVHAEGSAAMVELWGMPAEIKLAVGAHQQVLMDGFAHPVAAIVCVADALAHDLGCGVLPGEGEASADAVAAACLESHVLADRCTPATLEHAWEALAVNEKQRDKIREAAEEIAEKLRQSGE